MFTFNRDSCIHIPLDPHKESDWLKQVGIFLKRDEKDYNDPSVILRKTYYHVNAESRSLMVPRFFPIKNFVSCELNDTVPSGEKISIKSKVSFRDDRQKQAADWILNHSRGILCLRPGEGKTVVSIHCICEVGLKTIIFMHKDSLVEQWYERFFQHSDIREDQIARLRTSSYEDDLKKPVVLVTLQTLDSMIRRIPNIHDKLLEANFGFGIWDECHTVGAEQFSKTALFTPCKKVLGLSATPKRSDGNTDIIEYNLGPIFTPKSTDVSTMDPLIVMVVFDHGVVRCHYDYIMRMTQFDIKRRFGGNVPRIIQPEFDKSKYLKLLITSKNSKYLQKVSPIVRQISKSDRNMILLSDRIIILDKLAKCCVNQEEVGFFLPREKETRDAQLKEKRLVFSTYQSCRDGVDKPEVDCLVMANPVGNWEQAIGRSVRAHPGKKQPTVIDIVDSGYQEFYDWGMSRANQYKQMGWTVQIRNLD